MTRLLPLALALAAVAAVAQPVPGGAERGGPDLTPEARAALGLESEEAAALYVAAYADALALRVDAAAAGFRALGAVAPGSPAGAYGLEMAALWGSFVTEDDAAFDRFYALNDSLTAVAERLGEAPGAPLMAATAKLHRALAFARQERYARAANSFREGCARFRDLQTPDALFGQGVCEVAAGAIPREYRWVARLFGFRGSITGGLAKLEAAADAGGALALDAVVGHAIADATLNERRAGSVDRLAALAAAWPESPLLAYLSGFHLLLDRRATEAEADLRRAAALSEADDVAAVPFVDAHLGLALFRQRRFEEAAPVLERYTRTFRGQALLAQTLLHAGLAHEMLGDRRRAESFYRRVRARRDYDSDLSAAREAERWLATPLSDAERALLLGAAAYDGGDDAGAIALLQPVLTDRALTDVLRAEAAYRTGRAYQSLEDWAEARRHFQLAIDRPGDPLAKWGPWALYHQGEVFEATGDLDEAAARYRRVLENETDFDYHKSLEQRTRTALERIGR